METIFYKDQIVHDANCPFPEKDCECYVAELGRGRPNPNCGDCNRNTTELYFTGRCSNCVHGSEYRPEGIIWCIRPGPSMCPFCVHDKKKGFLCSLDNCEWQTTTEPKDKTVLSLSKWG